jgi:hypothetical protein
MSPDDLGWLGAVTAAVAGLGVVTLLAIRLQAWISRNQSRAPASVAVAFILVVVGGLVLVAAKVITPEWGAAGLIAMSLVSALWGWLRYRRSPHLRRWEATWERVKEVLAEDPDAADQLVLDVIKRDEIEREGLRAIAPHDRAAALAFLQLTKYELQRASVSRRLAARAEPGVPPDERRLPLILAARRARLEADITWIQGILSRGGGAA